MKVRPIFVVFLSASIFAAVSLKYLEGTNDRPIRDNPNLPRYLSLGDSISQNYETGLRRALKGKINVHRPPTNCGSSNFGRERINEWLGHFKTEGNQWDIISFNHGHWDKRTSKAKYQENLQSIISELSKTKAKLVWVSTCPVPEGFVNKYDSSPEKLNRWALEVLARYPEITICDQWQFVQEQRHGAFSEWWQGSDIHFHGETADYLGEFLAKHISDLINP